MRAAAVRRGGTRVSNAAPPPPTRSVPLTQIQHSSTEKVVQILKPDPKKEAGTHPCPTGASLGSFALRHHFNSWLSSLISIPGITMNLQLSISRGSSSSGSWQVTRQY